MYTEIIFLFVWYFNSFLNVFKFLDEFWMRRNQYLVESTYLHIPTFRQRFIYFLKFPVVAVKLRSNSICLPFGSHKVSTDVGNFLAVFISWQQHCSGTCAQGCGVISRAYAFTLVAGIPDSTEELELLSQTHLQTAAIQICALGSEQHVTVSFSNMLVWTVGWSRGRRNEEESVWMLCQREVNGTDGEKL